MTWSEQFALASWLAKVWRKSWMRTSSIGSPRIAADRRVAADALVVLLAVALGAEAERLLARAGQFELQVRHLGVGELLGLLAFADQFARQGVQGAGGEGEGGRWSQLPTGPKRVNRWHPPQSTAF